MCLEFRRANNRLVILLTQVSLFVAAGDNTRYIFQMQNCPIDTDDTKKNITII